jgi:phosphohistidine phosphatase
LKLFIVRHGEAVSEFVDPKRPLSALGRKDVERIAGYLKGRNIQVGGVFHSPKLRAVQTAEIVKAMLGLGCELVTREDMNPGDDISGLLNEILASKRDLMIVGHLPFISKLASQLVLNSPEKECVNFKAGSVALLEKTANGSWQISWSVTPKELPSV